MITIRLTQSIFDIQKSINAAIAKELNRIIRRRKHVILGKLKKATYGWIASTDEIASLTSPRARELKTYFGLTNSGDSVEAIIESIVESITVNVQPFDKNLKGSVTFNFQPENNQNLLSLSEGHQVTEKGTDLHWLDWLLTRGDAVIIIGYRYSTEKRGRAGVGIMEAGGTFRVDPRYSGLIGDNFVSRAFLDKNEQIVKIIEEAL